MPRTKVPIRIDHDALERAIEDRGESSHMLTIDKVRDIAEKSGLISREFRQEAYVLAANEACRRALRQPADVGEVPTFFNFKIEEELPDGRIRTIQGYKKASALTKEEWDNVIAERRKGIKGDMAMLNRIVALRNEYARENNWRQMKVPYPDID